MSLTTPFGNTPFDVRRAGKFDFEPPERVMYWEPWLRRMRALLADETVLDSRRGVILWETGRFARFFFPVEDVSVDRLPAKTLNPSPKDSAGGELLPAHVELPFDAMDRWFEEDDPIYAHPRDPYHRVDVRSASCEVVVRSGGSEIARSRRPKLLFETSVPTRYYLPFDDVRIGLLSLSDTVSECPYKGDGQHWHLQVADTRVDDVAWSLPHPLPEGIAAAEHISFYPEKVQIEVDGESVTH